MYPTFQSRDGSLYREFDAHLHLPDSPQVYLQTGKLNDSILAKNNYGQYKICAPQTMKLISLTHGAMSNTVSIPPGTTIYTQRVPNPPQVLSICAGLKAKGEILHPFYHIGATHWVERLRVIDQFDGLASAHQVEEIPASSRLDQGQGQRQRASRLKSL